MAPRPDILIAGIATADVIARTIDAFPRPGGLRFFDRLTVATGGCAVNVAIALRRLGIGCELVARVGADLFGDYVQGELARHGVVAEGVVRDPTCSTSFSFVAVNSAGERSFTHTTGANARLRRADVADARLAGRRFVFVTGAMLMDAFDGAPTAEVLAAARRAGAITLLDTVFVETASLEEWLRRIEPALPDLDCFVPSLAEARALTGREDPAQIARALHDRGARAVVIKMGERGAWCRDAAGRETLVPAFAIEQVVDATGAGDCWCAGFIAGLRDGLAIDAAARLGNAVASFGIQAVGATNGVPSLEVVRASLVP